MKVLGIMGSPRIKGNTDVLLDRALQGAQQEGAETEELIVDRLKIAPCREYYGCLRDGNCVIVDDMVNIYPRLLSSDVIIVASPIFFYGLSAQVKALIDRCQALWARKHVLGIAPPGGDRKGALIAVGATSGARLFDGAVLTTRYFFRTVGVSYSEELLVRNVDKRGEILEHPIELAAAHELGRRLVRPPQGGAALP